MHRSALAALALLGLVACGTSDTDGSSYAADRVEAGPTASAEIDWAPPSAPIAEIDAEHHQAPDDSAAVEPEVVVEHQPDTFDLDVEPTEIELEGPTVEIEVRAGESLYTIAAAAGKTIEEVAAYNGLDMHAPLVTGQALVLPLNEVGAASMAEARDADAEGRLERYLDRRGGLAGTTAYRVQTGDTAWGIASEQGGIPMWVLSSFNDDIDLDRLRIGDDVILPVLADTVALETPEEAPQEIELD